MIDGSSAWTTIVGCTVTIWPLLATIRSSWVKLDAASRLTTIADKIHSVARTRRGSGAARISAVSDWKSRIRLSGPGLGDDGPEGNDSCEVGLLVLCKCRCCCCH